MEPLHDPRVTLEEAAPFADYVTRRIRVEKVSVTTPTYVMVTPTYIKMTVLMCKYIYTCRMMINH